MSNSPGVKWIRPKTITIIVGVVNATTNKWVTMTTMIAIVESKAQMGWAEESVAWISTQGESGHLVAPSTTDTQAPNENEWRMKGTAFQFVRLSSAPSQSGAAGIIVPGNGQIWRSFQYTAICTYQLQRRRGRETKRKSPTLFLGVHNLNAFLV